MMMVCVGDDDEKMWCVNGDDDGMCVCVIYAGDEKRLIKKEKHNNDNGVLCMCVYVDDMMWCVWVNE